MKFINKTLCIVALCAISQISARKVGAAPAGRPAAVTPPARVTPPGRPAAQAQTFQQLHNSIFRMNSNDVIDAWEKRLKSTFIQKMSTSVKQMYQDREKQQIALKSLLQTGRDKFAPFIGDNEEDLLTLQDYNKQIEGALKA